MTDTNAYSNVITVDGYNRQGNLDTIRIAKPATSRLVALRRLQELQSQVIVDSFNQSIPCGMSVTEWRAYQLRNVYSDNLPPVGRCDYDVGGCGCSSGGGSNGGATEGAWLVGGNDADTLSTDVDSYILGINVSESTDPISNIPLDIVTAGDTRILIMGNDASDTTYQTYMAGRSLITNGFIAQEELPAVLNVVPTPTPITGNLSAGSVSDIYLERPSNAYTLGLSAIDFLNAFVLFSGYPTTLLSTGLVAWGGATVANPFTPAAWAAWLANTNVTAQADLLILYAAIIANTPITTNAAAQAYTTAAMQYFELGILPDATSSIGVLYISNIFLGDEPTTTATNTTTYAPNSVQVQPNANGIGTKLYDSLGINSFNYLLKMLNNTTQDIAIVFDLPSGSTIGGRPVSDFHASNVIIYSNANSAGAGYFLIPSGGAAFFEMRANEKVGSTIVTQTMLGNVEYSTYVE
jgi:hypothetical protein